MRPRVLIGYSTCFLTRAAFEAAGCEAWTCDLLPARDGSDRHFECDVWEVIGEKWNAALFHPMCTYLTVAAAWACEDPDFEKYPDVGYHQKVEADTPTGAERRALRDEAIENFKRLDALPYPSMIENPAPSLISNVYRGPDQTIHPYQFGDNASKRTGLWIRQLPRLKPTGFVQGRTVGGDGDLFGHGTMRWDNQTDSGQNKLSPGKDRWLERSKTYPGIAAAIGKQIGGYLARNT